MADGRGAGVDEAAGAADGSDVGIGWSDGEGAGAGVDAGAVGVVCTGGGCGDRDRA